MFGLNLAFCNFTYDVEFDFMQKKLARKISVKRLFISAFLLQVLVNL